MADAAARTGHDSEITVLLPLSRTDAARVLRNFARESTISQWNTPDFVHPRLHNLDPLLQRRLPCGLSRSESTLLCRLWLGVAFTKAYSFLIGMASSTHCDACGVEETIEHVFCRCPQYLTQRRVLTAAITRLDNRPFTIETVLRHRSLSSASQKATKAILRYLKDTGLHERL